mgnify:CR=1 FL=1
METAKMKKKINGSPFFPGVLNNLSLTLILKKTSSYNLCVVVGNLACLMGNNFDDDDDHQS